MFGLITYYRKLKPKFNGFLFKTFYSGSRIKVGKNFTCDTLPEVTVDKGCILEIGDNVLLRRNVEIRVHGKSKIIIGSNNRIDRGVRLLSSNESRIELGEGTRVGLYSVFNGGDDIITGKKCLVSGFVYLQTSMHNYKGEKAVQEQGYSHAPVVLGDDVWIGAHVVILPGCNIGNKSVIGSNAVVTSNVEEGNVMGGVPAKKLKER